MNRPGGQELASSRARAQLLLEDASFPAYSGMVIERSGLSYYRERAQDLAERTLACMETLSIGGLAEYQGMIQDETHWRELVCTLTIGETSFMRHADQLLAIQQEILLPLLRAPARDRRLSIWCAGCSTGVEARTLAILLRSSGVELAGWDVRLLATDLNGRSLEQARQGRYRAWSFRSVPEGWRDVPLPCSRAMPGSSAIPPPGSASSCTISPPSPSSRRSPLSSRSTW